MTDLQHRGDVVKIRAIIRGEAVELQWRNGTLTGEPGLVQRALVAARRGSVDLNDPAATLRCLEKMLGTRPEIELTD